MAVPPDDGDEGVTGLPDEGVPPPEPPIEMPPPDWFAFLFFFLSPGCTGTPPVMGGLVTGWTVSLEFELPLLPPLDAIAIRTIRNSAPPPRATSRRRRYTAGLSRIASTRSQLYTRGAPPEQPLSPD